MTDKGIPNTIKSGQSLLEQSTCEEETVLNVMSTMCILMEQSLKSAELYSKHAKRESILGKDIIIALQFQAHVFFNLPGVKEDCLELKEEMKNFMETENDEDTESCDESDEESDYDEETEEWTKSECDCGRCKAMNKFHEEWDNWDPTDRFQVLIKNAINSTIEKYE